MKVLYFSSEACKPCKAFMPIVRDVCDSLDLSLSILVREQAESIFQQYNIMSVPTIITLKNNKPYWSYTGTMSKTELLMKLKQLQEIK